MKTYAFKTFSSNKNIKHGISTRHFGSMKNIDGSINRDNLKSFLIGQNINSDAVCMGQVHSGNIEIVTSADNMLIDNTDGLITNKKDIPLCVVTADCLPILFYDINKKVIGVAHGGRKGLALGVIKNIISKFVNQFDCNPRDIIVGIGPGIEEKCYEVDGKHMNIRKKAQDQLLAGGIKPEHIENINICTKCSKDDFFSFRRGDKNDRFVSAITLV